VRTMAAKSRSARSDGRSVHSVKLFADDTPIPVLDPGRGRTKTGRLWVYARDDRPWSGPEPPAAVYFYSPDRKAERPAAHLQAFRGVLQVDGYAGFERLTAPGAIAGAGVVDCANAAAP
jgi:transposase